MKSCLIIPGVSGVANYIMCGRLFPRLDPRHFTATWRTSSTTAGSWRKGNPTPCESPPSRSYHCAPESRSCTASVTTGSMQMMSLTSSRYAGQWECGDRGNGLAVGQIRESFWEGYFEARLLVAVLWVSSSTSCSPALTLQRIQVNDVGLLLRLLLYGDVLVT